MWLGGSGSRGGIFPSTEGERAHQADERADCKGDDEKAEHPVSSHDAPEFTREAPSSDAALC